MRIIILDKKIVPNEEIIIKKKQVVIKRIQNREYTARFFCYKYYNEIRDELKQV